MPGLSEAMKDVISCDKLREEQISFDPQISEWGNPLPEQAVSSEWKKRTWGTETSQYPKEKKITQ